MIEPVQRELAALREERDQFVEQVNQEIIFRNGQISGLERLLERLQAPDRDQQASLRLKRKVRLIQARNRPVGCSSLDKT